MTRLSGVVARSALLVPIAALLVACGSGAVSGPDGDTDPTDNGATSGGRNGNDGDGGNPPEEEFRFTLPVGDEDAQTYEFALYEDLRTGDCGGAEQSLNGDQETRPWRNLTSQRDVLLFQAGIDLCRGDRSAAAGWLGSIQGRNLQGMDTTDNLCQLYQVSASVLRQVPPRSVECQGGNAPEWPDGVDFERRDDPRTAADEGQIPPDPPPGDDDEGDDGGDGNGSASAEPSEDGVDDGSAD